MIVLNHRFLVVCCVFGLAFACASRGFEQGTAELRRLAERGDAVAQNALGLKYAPNASRVGFNLTGSKLDAAALKWFRKSAAQGNAAGQNNLGAMYANGRGVYYNYVEAVKWLRKSAAQGDAWGQRNLGWMYANGNGVSRDEAEAMEWFRKATARGNWLAQRDLDDLEKKMTKDKTFSAGGIARKSHAKATPAPTPQVVRPEPLPRRKTATVDKAAPVIVTPGRIEADAASGTGTIRGTVKDKSEIASFTIDGREVGLLSSGGFEYPRYIRPGEEETLELVAIDRFGNRSVQKVTLARTNRFVLEKIEFEALDPGQSKAGRKQQQAAALIIGVEDYERMPEALYARTDANVSRDYAHRALGIPQGRIVSLLDSDADHFGIQDGVRRLRGLVDEKTDLYVYFAGHGFASGKGTPYLLPHDGDARYLDQLASRNDLFDSLAALKARSVTVFLDTCYSGRGRSGTVLAQGMRPLIIASSSEGVPEGFTVISAAASDEFSGALPEAEHGLFSYYLMRGLGGEADRDGDRAITAEELHAYISGEVDRQAARLGREQTPELFGETDRVLIQY